MVRLLMVLLVVVGVACADSRSRYYDEEERIAAEVFEHGKGYLKHLAPPPDHDHHHTNVTVNLYVRNVFSIGEKSHIWKVQLTFRQEWQDTRLAHKSELDGWDYLSYGNPDDIWTPDLFFKQEVTSQDVGDKFHTHDLLHIYPDGHVLLSKRITLELFCPVDFHQKYFTCPLDIASYMYNKDEMDIHWKTEDPIQISKKVFIPGYVLEGVDVNESCDGTTKVGHFSCIEANFKFRHGTCED